MKIKLTDLEASFIVYEKAPDGGTIMHRVDRFDLADGIIFLCPLCFTNNGGSVGTHAVICWSRSRGVPDDLDPKPGRWKLVGTGLHDLTLDGDAPGGGGARSVQLLGGCAWHGFITNGYAT